MSGLACVFQRIRSHYQHLPLVTLVTLTSEQTSSSDQAQVYQHQHDMALLCMEMYVKARFDGQHCTYYIHTNLDGYTQVESSICEASQLFHRLITGSPKGSLHQLTSISLLITTTVTASSQL